MSNKDKIAILGSAFLLLAIVVAGGYALSRVYHYNEPKILRANH